MEVDFSIINLQYLIYARDIAREDPEVAATVLGLSIELAELLAQTSSESLAKVAQIKVPLLIVRGEAWWWSRLFSALTDGSAEEVDVILDHASLAVLS